MRSRNTHRFAIQLESLEGRKAPSAGLSSGLHHAAEVHRPGDDNLPRHSGKDDGPNHNAGDDNNHNRNRHGR